MRKRPHNFSSETKAWMWGWKRSGYSPKVWMDMTTPGIPDGSIMVFRKKMSRV